MFRVPDHLRSYNASLSSSSWKQNSTIIANASVLKIIKNRTTRKFQAVSLFCIFIGPACVHFHIKLLIKTSFQKKLMRRFPLSLWVSKVRQNWYTPCENKVCLQFFQRQTAIIFLHTQGKKRKLKTLNHDIGWPRKVQKPKRYFMSQTKIARSAEAS